MFCIIHQYRVAFTSLYIHAGFNQNVVTPARCLQGIVTIQRNVIQMHLSSCIGGFLNISNLYVNALDRHFCHIINEHESRDRLDLHWKRSMQRRPIVVCHSYCHGIVTDLLRIQLAAVRPYFVKLSFRITPLDDRQATGIGCLPSDGLYIADICIQRSFHDQPIILADHASFPEIDLASNGIVNRAVFHELQ